MFLIRHFRPVALALSLLALPAGAGTLDGTVLPRQVVMNDATLTLNGAGQRSILGFGLYVAALYLPAPVHDAGAVLDNDGPRRLEITLLRDFSTEHQLDALRGGLDANNSKAELATIEADVERFLGLIRDLREVHAGEVMLLDYHPSVGTVIRVGDRELGVIPGARFNRDLLKIWLGDDPVQPSLKRALLGQDHNA